MTTVEFAAIDAAEAARLEADFLAGMETANAAYEPFVEGRGYIALGFDSFAEWWQERVVPRFRALEMKPTRELAARVIETVRDEERDLPALQRRTQQELADLAGVHRHTLANQDRPQVQDGHDSDLGENNPSAEDPLPPEIADQIERRIEQKQRTAEPIWSTDEYALLEQIRAGQTVVVSLRGQHENFIAWAEREGKYARIDRRTEWGNPFEMPADGDRVTVIANYANHYLPNKPSLLAKLEDLRGKALGCWCAPETCHGDALIAALEP
jgi:hypothetical protein